MIGTLDVKINAAHPNLPLAPFYTFVSSPSSVRVTNVPKKIGSWEITKVFVTANYPDNTSRSAECVNVSGCYVATLPLCNVVGESVNGFQITANGVDENGNAVTGYVLGHGDLIVLTRAGNITVGTTTWYFNFKDTQPTAPVKGDACIINGSLKWYNGTAWVDFGGFNLSDITLDLNADQATINEKLGEVIRRAGGTVIGCLAALFALSGMAAHVYPPNPDPSHKEFYGKMTRDSLVVTNAPEVVESDPVFTAWKGTNTYVKTEADPTVPSWAKSENPPLESDPLFTMWEGTNTYVKSGEEAETISTNVLFSSIGDGINVVEPYVSYKWTIPDNVMYYATSGYSKRIPGRNMYDTVPIYSDEKCTIPLAAILKPGMWIESGFCSVVNDGNETEDGFCPGIVGDAYDVQKICSYVVVSSKKKISVDFSTNNAPLVATIDSRISPPVTDAHIGEIATNVVRAANGGLWDSTLCVWWTPVMSNGKLTYQATTNVNLNAGN